MHYRLLLLLVFFILVGSCVNYDKENKEIREVFKKNHYNFALDKTVKYEGISFRIPKHFKQYYSHNYTIKNSSITLTSSALNIYFSVERFTKADLHREFVSDFIIKSDLLNTFQNAYVWRRYASLDNGGASIKKELPRNLKQKGVIQTVAGDGPYSSKTYYITATIRVEDNYYVFQWITSKQIMSYTYDDFERILKSVKKAK
ncbi:hypothetical protein [Fluviicola sp.]|jgi:hypothetical protein|uniref:hypothetical protein n=1 Tax=Fluviicola sp. TaxID=1917219 RepID=UPI0028245EB8|nr:hypothetical protein [Fluviicola sp.]MDR0802161.1 hypothetical protein [Fluviicola sp.]